MDHSQLKKTIAVLKQREFSFFLSTRFLVIFSLFMQTTVLSYFLYDLTHNPLSLGFVGLAEFIPAFIFAFFAGYIVDRREKRQIYRICIAAYILNALFFLGVTSRWSQVHFSISQIEWMIYTGMFVSGAIRAFLGPSSFSLLPLLVPKEQMQQAITWSSTTWMAGSVLGPLAGGLLLAYLGISTTMIIACLCLLVSFWSIYHITPKSFTPSDNIGILESLSQGFRFVFSTQIVLAVLCLDLFAVLFGGAEAMLPVFSKDILQVSEVGYGWLRSAHGIGSIFLLAVLAYMPLKTKVGLKMLLAIAGFGACIIGFGLSTNTILSFSFLFLAGFFDGVSVVIRHSILQLKTPPEIKGRVSSINMIFISSSNELGAMESGLAASLMGTAPSVVFGGFMTLLVVLVTGFFAPNLRKLKNLEET